MKINKTSSRKGRQRRSFDEFSDEEKQKLKPIRRQMEEAQRDEPKNLRSHLQAFNDGVLAIIITIIVLEIQPALHEVNYDQFLGSIIVFLITFFVIADFWYDLHIIYSFYVFRPGKATAILDFIFLADLALLPVMTKWIMEERSTFAVANFGVVFLIAKIFEYLIQFVGTKQSLKLNDSKIMNIIISHSFFRRVVFTLVSNIALIGLSFFYPSLAMILYLVIPVVSFIYPIRMNRL